MKRLKLKALELGAMEVLTRAQLKNVLGGDGSDPGCGGTTCLTCQTDSDCSQVNKGTCQTCDNGTKCCTGW